MVAHPGKVERLRGLEVLTGSSCSPSGGVAIWEGGGPASGGTRSFALSEGLGPHCIARNADIPEGERYQLRGRVRAGLSTERPLSQ
jgi:hypothetical protein